MIGIHYDLTDEAYHADPTSEGSLSHSGAKALLDCPARYKHQLTNRVEKPEYDFGHVVHRLVLGAGVMPFVVDADNWRTKVAQEAQREARASGLAPILRRDFRVAVAMRDEVRRHPVAARLFAEGRPEVSFFGRCPETRVMMRARADWLTTLPSGRPLIVDYKTTARGAHPDQFGRKGYDFGYDIQDPWYRETASAAGLDDPGFVFVIQETEPPYLVTVVEWDDRAREIGAERGLYARRLYLQCRTADHWPGYAPQIHRVSLPGYATAPTFEGDAA
jgi:hypothetical protein